MRSLDFDIAIVGGGMVGMTLACALAENSDLSIVILEANAKTHPFELDQYHHRVSAIALSSQRIFQSLKVWNAMRTARVSPFTAIKVWDAASKVEVDFECNEIAEPLLGHIIENNVMQNALREKISNSSQIQLVSPVKLIPFVRQDDGVVFKTEDNQVFHAKLAVAADGANSWLRDQVGIKVDLHDYDQRAIVASVQTEHAHEKCARQVFLPSGPLAFLPLADAHTSSIVWSLPSQEAKRLVDIDEGQFKQELETAFSYHLGAVMHIGKRFTFPLKKQQALQYVRERVALVGDAAHVMHPLAGQGVNVGLLDAASLAEVIIEAKNAGRDFSTLSVLRRYERWRKADNLALMTGVDAIKHFFASDNPSVQTARAIGLSVTNRLGMLKNIFTRYATGGREGLPRLAKGSHFG